MDGLDGKFMFTDVSFHVHKAGRIGGNNVFSAGLKGVLHLLLCNCGGAGLVLDREGPAETAADLAVSHLYQFQATHLGKQFSGFPVQPVLQQGGAGVMVSHFMLKNGIQLGHLQVIDKKVGEFDDVLLQLSIFQVKACIMKQFTIVIPHKTRTGGGRHHYRAVVAEFMDEFLTDGLSVIPETAVKGDLATACLVLRIMRLHTTMLQDTDHVECGLGINLVNETGDEDIYDHDKRISLANV